MPCCALAACIVGQLILAFGAIRGALFGHAAGGSTARNAAVEWRLHAAAAPRALELAPSWRAGRRSLRGLALAAALELVIVLGAIYGAVGHLGHGTEGEHARHARSAGRATSAGPQADGAPRGHVHASHD